MRLVGDESRERMKMRHEMGIWTGYVGLFMSFLAMLATSSEGTPFAPNEKAWVIFGFMLVGYLFGWAIAPLLNRLANPQ